MGGSLNYNVTYELTHTGNAFGKQYLTCVQASTIETKNSVRMKFNPNMSEVNTVISQIVDEDGRCPTQKSVKCPCDKLLIERKCLCKLFVEDEEK